MFDTGFQSDGVWCSYFCLVCICTPQLCPLQCFEYKEHLVVAIYSSGYIRHTRRSPGNKKIRNILIWHSALLVTRLLLIQSHKFTTQKVCLTWCFEVGGGELRQALAQLWRFQLKQWKLRIVKAKMKGGGLQLKKCRKSVSAWIEEWKWDVKVKWNGLRLKNGKPGKAFRLKTNSKEKGL